jgi:hypothetical protein
MSSTVTGKVFFQNTSALMWAPTKFKVNYKALQKFLTAENLPLFTHYTKAANHVKAVFRQLPGNFLARGITAAL